MLKAVYFDIDDTLFSTTRFAAEARKAAVEALRAQGVGMSSEELYRELQEVISEFSSNHHAHFEKLLRRLPPECLPQANRAILEASAVIAYHNAKYINLTPFEDVLPALKKLEKTSLILGVISAGLRVKQAEKLLRLRVYPYLDPTAIFISDQIGISKPNPKLFLRACAQLGVTPEETLYVGDYPAHDIDPANEIGMVTVWVRRGGKHADDKGKTEPNYTITDFDQLLTLLRRDFKVDLP